LNRKTQLKGIKKMQVSGWIETENGAEVFDYTAVNIRGIAKALIAEFGEDAGATDIEATDQNGEDITARLYNSLDVLTGGSVV